MADSLPSSFSYTDPFTPAVERELGLVPFEDQLARERVDDAVVDAGQRVAQRSRRARRALLTQGPLFVAGLGLTGATASGLSADWWAGPALMAFAAGNVAWRRLALGRAARVHQEMLDRWHRRVPDGIAPRDGFTVLEAGRVVEGETLRFAVRELCWVDGDWHRRGEITPAEVDYQGPASFAAGDEGADNLIAQAADAWFDFAGAVTAANQRVVGWELDRLQEAHSEAEQARAQAEAAEAASAARAQTVQELDDLLPDAEEL